MNLPPLSHLQVLVLESLGARKVSGRELRAALSQHRVLKSVPSFYQLMSRLEDAKFVEGEYVSKLIDGNAVKERFYRITGQGERALRETFSFYAVLKPQFA